MLDFLDILRFEDGAGDGDGAEQFGVVFALVGVALAAAQLCAWCRNSCRTLSVRTQSLQYSPMRPERGST